jgi:hypothetical protein
VFGSSPMTLKIGRILKQHQYGKGTVRILIGGSRTGGCLIPGRRTLLAVALTMGLSGVLGAGCQGTHSLLGNDLGRPSQKVRADWDDVEAAVLASTAAGEVAVITALRQETRWTFDLKTILGERGQLVVTLEAGSAQARDGSALIGVQASLGRRGDSDRERRLVRAVVERLRELAGRDTAPLPTTPE